MMHGFGMSFGLLWLIVPVLLIIVAVPVTRRLFRSTPRELKESESEQAPPAGQKEAAIYRLAKSRQGRITVSDVVVETGMSAAQAEETLQGMLDGMRVRVEVTDNGTMLYEFPELME